MQNIAPINYQLLFTPNLKTFRFKGKEKILIKLNKPARKIVLNSAELKINSCTIINNNKIIKLEIKNDEKNESLILKTKNKIKGITSIEITFEGIINSQLRGLYKSQYKFKNKRYFLATTQLEPVDARRVFPCFDYPSAKATFNISIISEKNLQAISNMPIIEKSSQNNKTLYKFATTPIMSTYLLYFAVGQFEYIEDNLNNIKIRIVTTKGKKHQAKLALKLTKQFLDYYQRYFKIPYPLPKLDMLAIPDFEAGAMENWGSITFRETAILFDEKSSSLATKYRIAEVIAHELAHQWFGNLVTMRWWDDLWLNESFATFMATKAVNALYPKWDFLDQYINYAFSKALSLDSLKSSHPIHVEVNKPEEIGQIFDAISYEKGGSILRMLEHFLTPKKFQRGLQIYLKKHEYSNATTDDLWNALEKASNQPVKEMMHSWINQAGYPIIETQQTSSILRLIQKRFLLEDQKKQNQKWLVPLSIKTKGKTIFKLMKNTSEQIKIQKLQWLKINENATGFYRVKYELSHLPTLKQLIRTKQIESIDRWQIHNDLFSLCLSTKISLNTYLEFLKSYENESDYLVLSDIVDTLNFIYIISANEEFWDKIIDNNKNCLTRIFSQIGWEEKKDEKSTIPLLRSSIILVLGKHYDKEILKQAKIKFNNFLKNPNSLNSNLRTTIYSLIAWQGSNKTYNLIKDLYKKAPIHEERIRFLVALCNFKDKSLLERTLDFSLSDEVKLQDISIPILYIAQNPFGKNLVWPWLKSNWNKILRKTGKTSAFLLKRIVESLSLITNKKQYDDISTFFKTHPTTGIEMSLSQTLEKIRIKTHFLEIIRKEFGN